ncbi:MAG: glycosyltransferase family 2 protein, partial [Vicinamibacterales bacterium]
MTTQPTVSVIIIFYNAAGFLAEAVDSVLAQTYADWELLLVDDGSSDESTALARRYVDADPLRIKYLDHPGHQNLGMSATRNRGLVEA